MKTFWKILKYSVLSIVALILVVLIYISISFSKLDFDDNFSTTEDYLSYYPESYDEARDNFRNLSNKISETYSNVKYLEVKVPSEFDNDLTIGVCYIPAQKDSLNLLILSSGVHGVEGYVGHAVHEMFIDKFLNDELLENIGVLLLHSINPYGFKHSRRVTENNVDMNRNSPSTQDLYSTVNDGYPRVYDLINPQKKVKVGSLENRFFFLKAVNEIRKASMPVLRQAVLQGQYQYPEGLYFGGFKPEPQIDSLKPIIETICSPYKKILALDLHTGYGERGTLHFFGIQMDNSKKIQMEELFQGFSIDWGESDDFYTVTGDFTAFLEFINHDKDFYPMSLEYGTLNSQTTMGSLKSIHIMILENQGQQHGYASTNDSLKVKHDLLEMYYPASENWRNHIMEQTKVVFEDVLPRFIEGDK
ncbi:MAG: hypothetical protein CVT98_05480 [Bacteroidetes bacterium HGW-Bacteroidetes-15]|nr:MAG: hypothetical protein CVT98_05480 [Bacteroidetes bacterium HGW-Bacteroidetes-15]